MRKKHSALDLHFAQKAGASLGLDWRILPLLGMGLALIGALLFGSQLYVLGKEHLEKVELKNKADAVLKDLVPRFKALQAQSLEFSQDPRVSEVLRKNLQPEIDNLQKTLEEEHLGYRRVRITSCDLSSYNAHPFPELSYGALDMLAETCSSQHTVKPEIHLYGTEDQHINFVSPVIKQDKIIGAILFSVSIDIIKNLENIMNIDGGYIEVRQGNGGWSDLKLLNKGTAVHGDKAKNPVLIPNTHLLINYEVSQKFGLIDIHNTGSLIIGIAACALLFAALLAVRLKYGAPSQLRYTPKPEDQEQQKTGKEDSNMHSDTDDSPAKTHVEPESPPQPKPLSEVPKEIFRAYDIRGIIDETLNAKVAMKIGQAVGSEAKARGVTEIVVARDGRLSGPLLIKGLIEGLISTGVNVTDIGSVPTGVLYYATHQLKTGSGVMVTGSHNPPNYNGFKIMLAGDTLSGDDIYALYRRIEEDNLEVGQGGVQELDILEDYVEEIADDIQLDEPLKVVIDCGNGIGGIIAEQLFNEIGAEPIPLYCDVDGNFPNHHPDPSVLENLEDLILSVKQLDADLGLAFDGDGDRVGVVTKDGDVIYPDRLMMLFSDDVLSRNPGATVIFDVKCTGKLPPRILHSGGSPLMWKTGHSFIKGKMKETGALLAGEMSGHIFFKERWYGFDDGLYAGARLLEILAASGRSPTEVLNELPNGHSTPELKIELEEGENFAFMEDFNTRAQFPDARITKIDGIRADFKDGWGLIRCSNTTPVLVMRFEADDDECLTRIQQDFKEQMLLVRNDLEFPF